MTVDLISILVPSRGRPQNVQRLLQSILTTAHRPDAIELVVRLDFDDPAVNQYYVPTHAGFTVTGKRAVLSDLWNSCWRASTGSILMLCGDDVVFRTQGWDSMVRDVYQNSPDRLHFVHGRDGSNITDFGTHGFLSREWTEIVGHFVPEGFPCDFVDSWLNQVANAINRRVEIPALFEHLHPSHGKAADDATYRAAVAKRALAQLRWDHSKEDRVMDVLRLRNAIAARIPSQKV